MMKRRDFIKSSAGVSISGFLGQGCSVWGKKLAPIQLSLPNTGPGFNVHPFVKTHPEAVFIHLTDVKEKTDSENIRSAGSFDA